MRLCHSRLLLLGILSLSLSTHALRRSLDASLHLEPGSLDSHANRVQQDTAVILPESGPSPVPRLIKRSFKRWRPDEEDRLVELRNQGKSWEEISASFPDRSWGAMKVKYYSLTGQSAPTSKRKKGKPWTSAEDKRMLKLLKDGLTWDEIAAKLPGRSRTAVYNRYYRRQGQDKAAPKSTMKEYTKEEDDVLIKTLNSGKSVAETARLLGKSHSSVTYRAAKLEEQGRLSLEPRSGRRYTVAELELIERLRETGTRWKEIRRLHFADRTVKQIMEGFRRYRLGKESREADD